MAETQFDLERMLLGDEAMQVLAASHVAVFGVGGVGSFAAEALARAGVGAITLVDHDTVSLTNLNRQLVALHSTLGMRKTDVMAEGLISSLLALLGGLICGGFLSEISSLATARLVGYGIIAHQSSFSIRAVILTTLGFLIIQSVALFVLCGKLFNKEIQQMLYGEMEKKQRTGSKSGNWLSLILGAVFLIFAYWIVLKHFMTAGNALIIVSVVFGIVGTVLSIRGLARLLSAAAASIKRKATSGLYIFTLRQLYHKALQPKTTVTGKEAGQETSKKAKKKSSEMEL